MHAWIRSLFSSTAFVTSRDIESFGIAVFLSAAVYLFAMRYPARAAGLTASLRASTKHTGWYVVAAMLIPVVVRLALVPWLPPPQPIIHDEFSHLLAADTLALGRLANPPHPLWRHFETNYILQQPAYASVYPLGQGFILGVGKVLFGSHWAGLLLSVSLMCGAIAWMLFGCLPAHWAALAGIIAAFQCGLAMEWVDTYYGGAFTAFGGALFFGSLCRLRRSPSWSLMLLAGLGWSIVWFTRPFESLLLLAIGFGIILFQIVRASLRLRTWAGPVAGMLLVLIAAGCVTALHNKAATGSIMTLPYQHEQQVYGVPQSLLWQAPVREPDLAVPEQRAMYLWQREMKARQVNRPFHHLATITYMVWSFFVAPWYAIPFLMLVFLRRDPLIILGLGSVALAIALDALYPYFFVRYVAAYSCVFFFLIARGLMKLRQWTPRGRVIGPIFVLFLVFGGSSFAILNLAPTKVMLHIAPKRADTPRRQISDKLQREGGQHVVFVRYGPGHNFGEELVYNAADIDSSPVVWCRATDLADEAEVIRYYKGRKFWLVDIDRLGRFSIVPYKV